MRMQRAHLLLFIRIWARKRIRFQHLQSIESRGSKRSKRPNRDIRRRRWRVFQSPAILVYKPRSGRTTRSSIGDDTRRWYAKLREGGTDDAVSKLAKTKHQSVLSFLLPRSWELATTFCSNSHRKRPIRSWWRPRMRRWQRTHLRSACNMSTISNSCSWYYQASNSTRKGENLLARAPANQTICWEIHFLWKYTRNSSRISNQSIRGKSK